MTLGVADVGKATLAVGGSAGNSFDEAGPCGGLASLAAGSIFEIDGAPEWRMAPHEWVPPEPSASCGAGLVLEARPGLRWVFSALGPAGAGRSYVPAIRAVLRRLAPELQQAFAVSHGLGTQRQPPRTAIEAAWDRLETPVMLLRADMSAEAMNVAAEELLSARRLFMPPGPGHRLRAASPADRERLLQAAERIRGGLRKRARLVLTGRRRDVALPVELSLAGGTEGHRPGDQCGLLAVFGEIADRR
ncbi:hypothetical protein AB5S17_07740 [Jiella sp. M17.18]